MGSKLLVFLCLISCANTFKYPVLQNISEPPGNILEPGNSEPFVKPSKTELPWYAPSKGTPVIELKEFSHNAVDGFLEEIKKLDGKTDEVWVRIDTNGGSIQGGQDIIHGLESMKSKVICFSDFKAYSMGFYVLQSQGCDVRLMSKRGSLMAHEPGTEVAGKSGDLKDEAELLDVLNEGFVQTASTRMKMTVEAFKAKIERRTWWMDWKIATEYYAIDGYADPLKIPAPVQYEIKKGFFDFLLGGHK